MTRYYRLNPAAQRRYLVDAGGISIHLGTDAGTGWSAVIADLDAFGEWSGPAGFDQLGAAWVVDERSPLTPPTSYWTAAGGDGLSRFDGVAWSYQPVTADALGMAHGWSEVIG